MGPKVRFVAATLGVALMAVPATPADDSLAGPVAAMVVAVIDGDTLAVRARIWLGQDIAVHVRLDGIDAPELRSRCAAERLAAQAARDALGRRTLGQPVQLTAIRWDKYGGRVVARVTDAAGEDLAAYLQSLDLVRAYDGGARAGWC